MARSASTDPHLVFVCWRVTLATQVRVLNELVQLLEEEVKSRARFGEAVLDEYMVRDWGENDSDTNCYAIAAYALVRGTPANDFVREDRPSMLELLFERLPQSDAYQYDMAAVVDAINTFVGPYGRVAEITEEPIEFDRCECIDPETGFQLRHEACMQKAVVIQKVIYTTEEAARKRREEDLVFRMVEVSECCLLPACLPNATSSFAAAAVELLDNFLCGVPATSTVSSLPADMCFRAGGRRSRQRRTHGSSCHWGARSS